MKEIQLQFHWPSLFDAIPASLLFVVLPGYLIWLVFKYTSLSALKKALLAPVCLAAPFVVTAFWPLALKLSGIIEVSGPGNIQLPYGWYSRELFGRASDYVWVALTALAILVLRAGLKAKHRPSTSLSSDTRQKPSAGSSHTPDQ